ncbi:non-ribosomal peptide synthetase, partial [Pseudomonas chlororaphis]
MDQSTALRIAQRFATLAADKQKIYWQKMLQENVSPANLPIPSVQAHFARLPLSYAQERQWFLWQLDPNSAAYNVPLALRLTGPLNLSALEQSFNGLVARHETLRTAFEQSDEGLHQRIEPAIQWVLEVQSVAPGQDLDAATADFVQQQSRQPFDLSQAPLLRVKLLRLASEEHVLALTLHHIVSDGWSAPILIDELIRRYQACCQGLALSFDALPVQYADYAIWQRQWMEAGERERQLQYWLAQLGGEQPRLQLPTDHPRLNVRSQSGGRWQWSLPTPLAGALARVAQDQGVTLFMLLLASFQTLLHRYSGQADIRVGVASANRNRVETEGLIGFFVNTQVLRADFGQAEDFSALLAQVKQRALDALAYQELPFEQLVEALQPERTLGQNPLFEVMFNFQSESAGQGVARQVAGLLVESLDSGRQAAQFDLTLDITERDGQLFAAFDYAADLFEAATLERMARHWENLLQGIVADPSQRISQLPLQDRQEQAAIVQDWNRHQTRFSHEQVLHQLIEAQAARAPDAVALSLGSAQLTYAQLNTRANRLAHRLIAQGVGPEVRVGLAAERSLEMLVGLLAILKAGGAYVPLDPSYPEERLSYMIEDSGIGLLLVQPHLLDRLPVPEHVASVPLETDESSDAVENPNVSVDPANLAYVIYTSGSTGKPKGALLAHQNVVRLFDATESWFHFDDQDVWTLFHSYAFDFSVWEIFGALLHGGRLVIVPQETSRSPEDFHRLLCEERVTVLNQTPSAFKPLMAVACAGSQANHLRYVVFGGEALEVKALKPWFERFGDSAPQLVNMYGITETTVHVTYRPLSLADLQLSASSPIGEPIPDLSWYLLDSDLNPVPRGCVGELYIGREGLARGYLNRSDLSATRFVPDPFDDQGGRLYRTGDLARYHADGLIEYIGRIDQQVKIRGFRIELGEIEARLLAQPEVREVAVLAQDGASGPQLVAYLVASQGAVPAEDQAALRTTIKEGLKEHLPDYMVPAHVLFLEQLPLTANGKLDRKALPAADASLLQRAFVAPQSPLQQQVAAIWQEVLQVERVGLDDNFFELGGHSLLATQLVSRIRQGLQREVALKSLFEHDTLGTFVAALEGGAQRQESSLPRVERGQPLALSYAQERQWFLWQMDPHSAAYHVPMALRLKGALDRRALQSSFEALVARHESLRTTFVEQGSRTLQVIHADAAPVIVWADLAQQGTDQDAAIQAFVAEEIQQPFDLRQGPLLRIKLLRLAPDDHVLVLVQHHIVSDGWSMRLMVDELVQLYGDFSEAQVPSLPALPIQYADYAQWQRNWMDAGERERQLAYWQEQLAGESALLELPLDRPRPAQQSFRGARLDLPLPERLAEHLKALARSEGVTLFMLLLASFQTLLHRYSGQADIRVGVPIANRNRAETESLIGFFVNTQVLKAEIDSQGRFRDFLQQVKQASLGAQAHQDLPFEQLVEALQPGRSLSHSPLFQVLFNHQAATHEETRQLPGLVIEDLSWAGHTAQFDLTLDTHESANGIWASLTYATDVFDPTTVQRMAQHWHTLLQGVVDDPSQRISQLPLQDRQEQAAIVQDWNRHQTRFNHEQVLHQLIEAQAARAP